MENAKDDVLFKVTDDVSIRKHGGLQGSLAPDYNEEHAVGGLIETLPEPARWEI